MWLHVVCRHGCLLVTFQSFTHLCFGRSCESLQRVHGDHNFQVMFAPHRVIFKAMGLTDLEVVEIVRWSDLQGSSAKLPIHVGISNDGNASASAPLRPGDASDCQGLRPELVFRMLFRLQCP